MVGAPADQVGQGASMTPRPSGERSLSKLTLGELSKYNRRGGILPSSAISFFSPSHSDLGVKPDEIVVGTGHKRPKCGAVRRVVAALDRHIESWRAVHGPCHSPDCPNCGSVDTKNGWVDRAVKSLLRQVHGELVLQAQEGNKVVDGKYGEKYVPLGLLRHISFSHDNPNISMARLKKWFHDKVEPILKTCFGADGGAVVLMHPRRTNQDAKDEFAASGLAGQGIGIWSWLYAQGVEAVYSRTHYAPHIHVIFKGNQLPHFEKFHQWTGGRYIPLSELDQDLDQDSLRRVLRYQFSHAWMGRPKRVYWSIGCFAARRRHKEHIVTPLPFLCDCGKCNNAPIHNYLTKYSWLESDRTITESRTTKDGRFITARRIVQSIDVSESVAVGPACKWHHKLTMTRAYYGVARGMAFLEAPGHILVVPSIVFEWDTEYSVIRVHGLPDPKLPISFELPSDIAPTTLSNIAIFKADDFGKSAKFMAYVNNPRLPEAIHN